jgi:hypothetical protein
VFARKTPSPYLCAENFLRNNVMKKKVIIALASLALCAGISMYVSQANRAPQLSDLALQNVEALADDEDGITICIGSGDINCMGKKVALMYLLSLP